MSDWYAVRVADAVKLIDRTSITIVPPSYAAKPARTILGFSDLECLQFSTATIRLHFNRPAESAVLEWRPDGRSTLEGPDSIPVELGPDRTSGTAPFSMRANGVLGAVLVNEQGPRKLKSETTLNVRVVVDAPPTFEQVSGLSTKVRMVRPGERLMFEFVAVDDEGIVTAELESSTGTKQSIPLAISDRVRASGRIAVSLPAVSREGDPPLRFRLRVRDNRRVDEARIGPQEALYPAEGWSEFQISDSAQPLDQQEIFGLRDVLREGLKAALHEVEEARTEAELLRADTAGRSPLPIDHGLRLVAIRDRVRQAKSVLEGAAREASLAPDLRGMARAIGEVAERPLRETDDALQQATTDNATNRIAALIASSKHSFDSCVKLEALLKQNERLAQDRLDRRRLESLASDQTSLADQARTGSANEVLLKKQRELLARLSRLIAESDPLKRGGEAAAARESAQLANEAKAIGGMLRELDSAANRLNADLRKSLLSGLADALLNDLPLAAKHQPRFETPTRLAGLALPKREDVQRVAELLRQDKVVEALTELERLAQALDRLATEFDRWTLERNDPKLAAQQLAKWQDDLRTRLLAATKPMSFDRLPEMQREAIRGEQVAILASTERLRLPSSSELGELREAAIVHLRMAVRRLNGDGVDAEMAMRLAGEALTKLGEKLPSVADRLAASRTEFDKLRSEQEAIIAGTEQVLRTFDKQIPIEVVIRALIAKFAPWQVRQKRLTENLAALDLPGYEPRRARVVAAAKTAAGDLNDGLPYDSNASLAWSKRELDRLRQALDSLVPADEKAIELAHKQSEVVRLFAAAGERATDSQLVPLVVLQLDVFRQRESLVAPEATGLLNDVLESVRLAELSLRNGSRHDQMLRRTREASESLALLAERLNERETDRNRVLRLASNRKQAECLAKKFAGKPLMLEASDRARAELKSEIAELMSTRVGVAGQVVKKSVHEAYVRLQNKTEPDRQAADQKQLAASLHELANSMAKAVELTTRPKEPAPAAPDPADTFLPSKPFADGFREQARRQRDLRQQANSLAASIAERSKPAASNPLAKLEERQRTLAIAIELLAKAQGAEEAAKAARLTANRLTVGDVRAARDSGQLAAKLLRQLAEAKTATPLAATQEAILAELPGANEEPAFAAAQQNARQELLAKKTFGLAQLLDLAAKNALPGEPAAKSLADAASLARQAERLLRDSAKKSGEGQPVEASRLRTEADRVLQQAADKIGMGGPPIPEPPDANAMASGEAARDAERSMQRAIGKLGPKDGDGDASAAEQAMRRAADSLSKAAKQAGADSTSQPPRRKPLSGTQSNGTAPATTGD